MIGERVWIDSLAQVTIGPNVCISQDVYLCCGNHDWTSPTFMKSVKPITIEEGAWIATRATILPGVTIGSHAVIAAGAIVSSNCEPYQIYVGNPAKPVKERIIRDQD
jgi:putative colanic acid biosynthesis acetyltransferase WcaF